MAIKSGNAESKNICRTPVYCLASQLCDGLVHVRRPEEVKEVLDSCVKFI